MSPLWAGAVLRPEPSAAFTARTFLFVRIVPRVLAGLRTVLSVIFLGEMAFFYSNRICVFNDEASFCVLLGSQK